MFLIKITCDTYHADLTRHLNERTHKGVEFMEVAGQEGRYTKVTKEQLPAAVAGVAGVLAALTTAHTIEVTEAAE